MESRQSLRAWQRRFKRAVTGPAERGEGLGLKRSGVSAKARLDVYRYAYRARLEESLTEDFALLSLALGRRKFRALARAYIGTTPSRSPDLAVYSVGFRKHLLRKLRGSPWLAFLVERDWRKIKLAHRAEPPPEAEVSPDQIAGAHGQLMLGRAGLLSMIRDSRGFVFAAWRHDGVVSERRLSRSETVVLRHLGKRRSLRSLAARLPLAPGTARRAVERLRKDRILRLEIRPGRVE